VVTVEGEGIVDVAAERDGVRRNVKVDRDLNPAFASDLAAMMVEDLERVANAPKAD
jgi:hypothetical protein